MTLRLFPLLLQSADPRVVTLASPAHRQGKIEFDNLQHSKLDAAAEIASRADEVRGYGEVNNRAMRAYAAKVDAALAQLQDGPMDAIERELVKL